MIFIPVWNVLNAFFRAFWKIMGICMTKWAKLSSWFTSIKLIVAVAYRRCGLSLKTVLFSSACSAIMNLSISGSIILGVSNRLLLPDNAVHETSSMICVDSKNMFCHCTLTLSIACTHDCCSRIFGRISEISFAKPTTLLFRAINLPSCFCRTSITLLMSLLFSSTCFLIL